MRQINLVHHNTDYAIYAAAERKEEPLFYSVRPTGPDRILNEHEFRSKADYWVPPHKAMALRSLILAGFEPMQIVRTLGLTFRRLDDVIREFSPPTTEPALISSHYRPTSPQQTRRYDHDGGFIAPIVDAGWGGDGGGGGGSD